MAKKGKRLALGQVPTRLTQLHPWPDGRNGIRGGDCLRTALAMILGLPNPKKVPHFINFEGDDVPEGMGWPAVEAWMAARGVQVVNVPLRGETIESVERQLPGWVGRAPAVLTGYTRVGHCHCAAVIEGRLVDPWPGKTHWIVAPSPKTGLFWLTLLVPMPPPAP